MVSANFTIDSQSVGETYISTTEGTLVTCSLASTEGVKKVDWSVVGYYPSTVAIPTFTKSGVPSGSQATFIMPNEPDDYNGFGVALVVQCKINNGRNTNGTVNLDYTWLGIVGVENANGQLPFALGETGENGSHAVVNRLNQILRYAGQNVPAPSGSSEGDLLYVNGSGEIDALPVGSYDSVAGEIQVDGANLTFPSGGHIEFTSVGYVETLDNPLYLRGQSEIDLYVGSGGADGRLNVSTSSYLHCSQFDLVASYGTPAGINLYAGSGNIYANSSGDIELDAESVTLDVAAAGGSGRVYVDQGFGNPLEISETQIHYPGSVFKLTSAGELELYGGYQNQENGNVKILASDSIYTPGYVTLAAGDCTDSGSGANVNISAGDSASGNGGVVAVYAGDAGGVGSSLGGSVVVTAGNSTGSDRGGSIYISAGDSPSGDGGLIDLNTGSGLISDGEITLSVHNTARIKVEAGETTINTQTLTYTPDTNLTTQVVSDAITTTDDTETTLVSLTLSDGYGVHNVFAQVWGINKDEAEQDQVVQFTGQWIYTTNNEGSLVEALQVDENTNDPASTGATVDLSTSSLTLQVRVTGVAATDFAWFGELTVGRGSYTTT